MIPARMIPLALKMRSILMMRPPHRRSVENWTTFLRGFTETLVTQHNNALEALKTFLNAEIFGPGGPTKEYRGESRPARMYEQLCTLSHSFGCSVHMVRYSDSERVQH